MTVTGDQDIVARFDGSDRVAVHSRDPFRVMAIAHELGYSLQHFRFTTGGTPSRMIFVRDDSPTARHRAAWTDYYIQSLGSWRAGCWPPNVPPSAIDPEKAAGLRLAVHLHEKYRLVPPMLVLGALCAGSPLLAWNAWGSTVPVAIFLALFALSGFALLWLPGYSRKVYTRYLADLERFDQEQRFYPPNTEQGRPA
ncbi:hypothetical protein [Streptomyces litchfieldiae]|uniref:Uncharacterized protein n=1 Tax=Streptomyces litchfieldiae TaxID=3075543 RepID=A0ABU2MNM7_9ACTN|nr:hypothetical protein [Streptomyces sp. DSM 44938]MDT0343221.1 hypothetical protein [Streptomyces sp. DSM 44938]